MAPDESDLAAVVAVQHQADRINISDLELTLIELVCGAPAAVAAHDIDINAGFLEPAALRSHDHADAAALRQPSHIVGDLLLGECRATRQSPGVNAQTSPRSVAEPAS